jgi:hypothetical protein
MKPCIVITGATGKVGKILVGHFLMLGYDVVAVGRCHIKLNELSSLFPQYSASLNLCIVDLISNQSTDKLNKFLCGKDLEPDYLINNARNIEFLQTDHLGVPGSGNFLKEFELGVLVPYLLTMGLSNRDNSRLRAVVNIGSIYGSVVPNLGLYKSPSEQTPIHYGVSKAALEQLTRELAVRLASRKLRVNCVAFGGIRGRVDDEFMGRYSQLCPAGRMLGEDEIAGPVEMLLAESSMGINGHVLMVDGGWTLW